MSNIYSVLERLNKLHNDPKLSKQQDLFVSKILNGVEGKNGWKKVDQIVKNPSARDISNIRKSIENELKHSSFWDFKYRNALRRVSNEFGSVLGKLDKLKNPAKRTKKFAKLTKKIDIIVHKTVQDYHGAFLLPVCQGLDPRLGASGGECFGYIAEWSSAFIKGKMPFNVDPNEAPPFKFINYSSPAGRKYPGLNHTAPLTQEISIYQKLQAKTSLLIKQLSANFLPSSEQISYNSDLSRYKFYKSPAEIAGKLVEKTNNNPNNVYNLNVMGYLVGHALGFCVHKGKYHFLDSNLGWFRFDNADDFKRWFVYYYQEIGYKKYFSEYTISIYHKDRRADDSKLSWQGKAVVILLISAACIPFIMYMFVAHFIFRGFWYLGKSLGNAISSLFSKKDESDPSPVQVKPDHAVDDLDRLLNKTPLFVPEKSSHASMAGILNSCVKPKKGVEDQKPLARDFPLFPRKPKEKARIELDLAKPLRQV